LDQFSGGRSKGVKGIRKVKNGITVEPKKHRFDNEIKEEIERRLKSNVWIFDEAITIEVKNGKVILGGTVGSEAERNRVRYNSWVTGVKEVEDLELAVNSWIRSKDLRKTKPVSFDDDEIKEAVREAFLLDPRVKSASVEIQVKDGIVELEGTVEHLLTKKAAGQDASNTVGVRKVINNIKINFEDVQKSDEELVLRIEKTLTNHSLIGDFDLEIKVQNKNVILNGEVETLYEKSLVEQVVSSTRGVENIENQLSVISSWPNKKDEKIREDIQNLISWSLFINGEDIIVSVKKGVANVSGKIFDWKGVHNAVEKGFQGGAKMVKINLTLKTGEVVKGIFDYQDIRLGL
jgi:osmotically-inducible protein OsmY